MPLKLHLRFVFISPLYSTALEVLILYLVLPGVKIYTCNTHDIANNLDTSNKGWILLISVHTVTTVPRCLLLDRPKESLYTSSCFFRQTQASY